ncbi:MAG: hypothetical protein U0169_15670 [Polyangiaceae bacterium]
MSVLVPAFAAACLVAGCSAEPSTGFLVQFSSQLDVRHLAVRVSNEDRSFTRCLDVALGGAGTGDGVRLPASLGVQPEDESVRTSTVRVEALAFVGAAPDHPCDAFELTPSSIRTESVAAYVPGAVLELPVPFSLSCLGLPCDPGTTCRAGTCVDARVAVDRLPRRSATGTFDGTCFDLASCTPAEELVVDASDRCAFPRRNGLGLPASFTPYVRLTLPDGTEARAFLERDEFEIGDDARPAVYLTGHLCDFARQGLVRGVGFAEACGTFPAVPVCAPPWDPAFRAIDDAVLDVVPADGGADGSPRDATVDATLQDGEARQDASDATTGGDATTAPDTGADSASASDSGEGGADGATGDGGADDGGADAGDGQAGGDAGDAGGSTGGFTRVVAACGLCCGQCVSRGMTGDFDCTEGFPIQGATESHRMLAASPLGRSLWLEHGGAFWALRYLDRRLPDGPRTYADASFDTVGIGMVGDRQLAIVAMAPGSLPTVAFFDDVLQPSTGPSFCGSSMTPGVYDRIMATDSRGVYLVRTETGGNGTTWSIVQVVFQGGTHCSVQEFSIPPRPSPAAMRSLRANDGRFAAIVDDAMGSHVVAGNFDTRLTPVVDDQGVSAFAPLHALGVLYGSSLPFAVSRAPSVGATSSGLYDQSEVDTLPTSRLRVSGIPAVPHLAVEGRPGGNLPEAMVLTGNPPTLVRAFLDANNQVTRGNTGPNPRDLVTTNECVSWIEDAPSAGQVLRTSRWETQ